MAKTSIGYGSDPQIRLIPFLIVFLSGKELCEIWCRELTFYENRTQMYAQFSVCIRIYFAGTLGSISTKWRKWLCICFYVRNEHVVYISLFRIYAHLIMCVTYMKMIDFATDPSYLTHLHAALYSLMKRNSIIMWSADKSSSASKIIYNQTKRSLDFDLDDRISYPDDIFILNRSPGLTIDAPCVETRCGLFIIILNLKNTL